MADTVFNLILFAVLPYVALALFFLVSIQRYLAGPFTYSSLSSQFLENREHFWGMVPFHYGIITVLTGHLVAFLIPGQILWWNSAPLRLYLLEITGLAFAILAVVGLLAAAWRRLSQRRIRIVTSPTDWVLLAILLFQIGTGLEVAVKHRWGSSWFAAVLSPYLWSLLKAAPDTAAVSQLPITVKLHFVGACVLIGFLPFTRLVHVLVAPLPYLWRRPQVVRWWRARPGMEQG